MCCFAGPVQSVSNTRIFARLSGQGTQFVAYQMKFKTEQQNAMILPLPAEHRATEQTVRFVDLSGYDRFFSDLRKGFPSLAPPPPMAEADGGGSFGEPQRIAVHDVGDFEASFVPKMPDFKRLDPRFVIPADVWAKIPQYSNYSFAVFQLKELAGQPHPMAFEFRTRFPDTIFFPTVHIHDGDVHPTEKFQHTLYSQHAAYDPLVGEYTEEIDPATRLVRSQKTASEFMDVEKSQGLIDGRLLVHRRTMRGKLPNQDVLLAARGSATEVPLSAFSPRRVLHACGLWPLAWLLHRRGLLARRERD